MEELLTFVRNQRGRPEAQQGAHDDCVIALAIAYYCRDGAAPGEGEASPFVGVSRGISGERRRSWTNGPW